VVIVQGDRFDATASTTVCPLTTNPTEVPLTRIPSEASPLHGPDQPSRLMVDKVMTMPRSNLREHLGRLPETDLVRLNRSLIVFLGLPGWESRRGNRDPIEENVSQGSPGCSCPRCSVSCARVI
jgi:mRNA interferase MazF